MLYQEEVPPLEPMQYCNMIDWTDELVMDPSAIVDNTGSITIPDQLWKEMNRLYTKEQIKRVMSRAIVEHNIPPPYQPITEAEAKKTFKVLKNMDTRSKLRRTKVFSRFPYKYRIDDVVVDAANTGNVCSNYFHQASRWLAGNKKFQTPHEIWTNKRWHSLFMNNLFAIERKRINKGEFRAAIALRTYIASQFKPQAAKILYDLFNSKHILDLSSGWGDRNVGFCASNLGESYTGIDPNTRLYEGYAAQAKMYGKGKDISFNCTGSESFKPPKGKRYDTIFTSPPYFNVEQYSDDPEQSFLKHGTFNGWLTDFLFPTIDMAWKHLDHSDPERGGIIGINISDVTDDKNQIQQICDPMNDYFGKKKGARYIGCIGLRLALRPNLADGDEHTDAKEDAAFIEPIWLWAKGGTWELDDYIEHGFKKKAQKGLFK